MSEETVTPTSEEEVTTEAEAVHEPEQQEDESLEEYKVRLAKAEELAENYKRRAEKAEKKAKEAPKAEVTSDLSQADILFLAKADIHEDDIGDLTTWAKNNGISVREAYTQFKPVLDVRGEERKTAQATETKSARGVKAKTGEDILSKAETTGEVPTDEASIKALIAARTARRRNK